MIPKSLDELFSREPSEIDYEGGNVFDLNVSLGLAPWLPPVVEVWKLKGDMPDYENADHWNQVLTVLNQLHDEHKRRNHENRIT